MRPWPDEFLSCLYGSGLSHAILSTIAAFQHCKLEIENEREPLKLWQDSQRALENLFLEENITND